MNAKQKQSKWGEIGDDVIKLISQNWWKVILIILAGGIAITGFTCKFGKVIVKKDAIIKDSKISKPMEKRKIEEVKE